jgi:predicted lipoprotein with Yx(FWY)xxD motif
MKPKRGQTPFRLAFLGVALLAFGASATPASSMDGTKISVRGSDYGRMLWAPERQAIYMFENDKPDKSRCYGECAKDWPPVLAKGKPRAGRGVDPELLGTTKRRNGNKQVTYAGRPLYTYAHEGRGDVFCHDVELNGGYWWALGADGEPLP